MRTAHRLSILALTLAFVAMVLAAGERPSRAATPQAKVAAPSAPAETSVGEPISLSSPWPRANRSAEGPEQAERDKKIFAWLILLLKENRSAR
jgi:hypothetical protein